ncbi:MAG: hypothetical protein LBK67_13520 [Coriobacteriales bacterium]|jgi:hypothetical protein|nr:hypothetical protein [Coriobacteriales bacterium]
MATSSIFNSIHIADEASCQVFLDAVDSSREAKKKDVRIPSNVKVIVGKEDIDKLFKR